MGFWHRLLGSGADRSIGARAAGTALPRRWRTPEPQQLSCDPREAAQMLLLALDNAAAFDFHPIREITVDDIDFDYYNGPQGFRLEQLSALLRLSEDDGTPLFPRSVVFDPQCVDSNDTYAHLLRQVAEVAGTDERFAEIHCDLHFGPDFLNNPVGELSYLRDGEPVQLDIAVEGEWADPDVVAHIFRDATPTGYRWVPTGDYGVHVWVLEQHAEEVARIFASEDTAAEARIAGRLHEEGHRGLGA